MLGDWFANPVAVGHERFILLVCEHSRLPVVMPARDAKHLARNFPDAMAAVLSGLGATAAAVEREVEAAREAVVAATNNRSVVGTLVDFSYMLSHRLRREPADLVELSLWLAHTPVTPMHPDCWPDKVTRRLLT